MTVTLKGEEREQDKRRVMASRLETEELPKLLMMKYGRQVTDDDGLEVLDIYSQTNKQLL